jgi:hypothetical protein
MSAVTAPTVTPTIANWWLSYYGAGGYKPGSFTQSLMSAIVHADLEHTAVMAGAFPGLVEGHRIANSDDGLNALALIGDRP